MGRLDDIYKIVGAYGLGRVLPQGSTRAAAKVAIDGIIRSGKMVIPAAARAAPRVAGTAGRGAALLARRHPVGALSLAGYGAYEAGLLDPIIDPIQERIEEDLVIPLKKTGRRRASGFNKAISASMKAVKASKFYGKKGTLNNSKKAFSKVTKTVAALRAGRKGAASGVTGLIRRTARRFV